MTTPPIQAPEPAFRLDDRVCFRFGAETDPLLFGTIVRFTPDRSGRPAAVIAVAGLPGWTHVEPLDGLKRAHVVGSLFWGTVERIQRSRYGLRCRGCTCKGRDAGACLTGFFGQ